MPVRLIRRQREAPLDERDRLITPPLLMREHAGVVQRARMIRVHLEHPAIQLLGLDQLLIFLEQRGDRDRLFDRQRAARRFRNPHDVPGGS